MQAETDWHEVTVAEVGDPAEGVRQIDLDCGGRADRFAPGSHLSVSVMIAGKPDVRSYSLLPTEPGSGRLRIGVKRHPDSRGGSDYMWSLRPGARLTVTAPANHFALRYGAPQYLLVAGGIGITPILGMALALQRRGADLRLLYAGRSRAAMPYLEQLQAALGDRLEVFASDESRRIDLRAEIGRLVDEGELYICGPIGLLDETRALWRELQRPVDLLRFEVFGDSGRFAPEAFRVEVPNLHRSVEVPVGRTMLDALIESGVDMIYDCRRGECGLCAVEILSCDGQVDHRDVFLSDEEKQENSRICTCVSRVIGGSVAIDTGYRP